MPLALSTTRWWRRQLCPQATQITSSLQSCCRSQRACLYLIPCTSTCASADFPYRATCARDASVRVCDANSAANIAIFCCHTKATKRVLLENSPDTFLTVAEDGCVRQHDLRSKPHECRRSCPPPLVQLPHELHSISSSVPHQFVVAGEGDYGYLFDRRQVDRVLQQEWGVPVQAQELSTCVRRFGRPRLAGESQKWQHITGVRTNGSHEVVLVVFDNPRYELIQLFQVIMCTTPVGGSVVATSH